MKYVPNAVPQGISAGVRTWLASQLRQISEALAAPDFQLVNLEARTAEPQRVQDGDIVRADGVNWNPGSGEGIYARLSGAWVKL